MGARRAICFGLLFVLPPRLKPFVLRLLCHARVGRDVSIGWFSSVAGSPVSLGDYSTVAALTVIRCDGEVSIGAYSQVSSLTLVYGSAGFVMGDHSYIGPQSLINTEERVRLGHHTALGARAMVYTHGSWLPYTEGYWVRFGAVDIGDYVWCAAGVFLHPGVTIGDRVFVNSRSVVTADIPDDSVVEGVPARVVARMDQLRRKMTPARVDAAIREMLQYFAEVELRRAQGLEAVETGPGTWRVRSRGRTRHLIVIGANSSAALERGRGGGSDIYLVNLSGWASSLAPTSPMLDFTTLRSRTAGDDVCEALATFLKRYYGVQFEQEHTAE